MSIPSFSAFPEIPQRSTPEADFDAKMYALFQHFATTHRQELLAFIQFLENNVTAIEGAINGVTIGLTHPAAAKFTSLAADSISGAAVQASPDDTTAGRLAKVGAFGWGGSALVPPNSDLDQIGAVGGLYYGDVPQVNTPPQFTNSLVLHMPRNAHIWTQIAVNRGQGDNRIVVRRKTGEGETPTPWSELVVLDENGRTAQNVEIRNSGPFLSITDVDTGVKHTLSGNSTAGHLHIKTDPAQTMPASALLIETQGVRQMEIAKEDVKFNVPVDGELNVNGAVRPGYKSAGNAEIKVGLNRVADGPSFLDLISDTDSGVQYGTRIIRSTGANGGSSFTQRGTGSLTMQTEDVALIQLKTNILGINKGIIIDQNGTLRPTSDNTQQCGGPGFRWSEVFAGAGTINTSDARTKTDIQDLDAAERRVAVVAKSLLKKYRMRDAVAEKGDAARWHFGVIAQELAAAFEAEGLDPWRYGVLCWDEWWSAEVEIPAETTPIMEEVEEEITHTVMVEEPVLDEHGAPTGELQQVEKEVVERVKTQVETGELEILVAARTELQTFDRAEDASEGAEYHNRQGVRYDELFAFILAAL
ncbi:tail fiber domain-containing protein [Tritonibacter mobilis]|uniref:tail fiber domain-containing protein n=1 Tax=Tritonibacter mobilis TaxID=379347 RepID=UPI001CDA3A1E|nr:tail fiber domain-containing protein [Tritonibacter mobilis]MCA2007942.1 tail fiber domain-containing protein [Tritonibacter mobilis]